MSPELKAKWIAALRSGNYPQAKGKLRGQDGFCCIGVLCDVAGMPFVKLQDYKYDREPGDFIIPQGEDAEPLTIELRANILRYLDLDEADQGTLISMNDGRVTISANSREQVHPPQDFNTIADWIEKNL